MARIASSFPELNDTSGSLLVSRIAITLIPSFRASTQRCALCLYRQRSRQVGGPCSIPPRLAPSFPALATDAMFPFGQGVGCSVGEHPVDILQALDGLFNRSKLVSVPPSHRWVTWYMPHRRVCVRTTSWACFFVPTNRTDSLRDTAGHEVEGVIKQSDRLLKVQDVIPLRIRR